MDTARTLAARVVIKPDDKGVGQEIREGENAHCAIKGDLLTVSDGPIVRALSRIRYRGNDIPAVFIERVAREREGNRIGGRRGGHVYRAARALPALRGLDGVLAGLVDGKYRRAGARLAVHRGAALFERHGSAGGRGNGNRRREERERYRVAVDHAHGLCVRGLPAPGRGNCPRPGLRQRQNALPVYSRPRDCELPLRRRNQRAAVHRDIDLELRSAFNDYRIEYHAPHLCCAGCQSEGLNAPPRNCFELLCIMPPPIVFAL